MNNPEQGYSVGTPKTKRHGLAEWFKDNVVLVLKVGFIIFAIWCFTYTIGASVRDDDYEKEARADCYASGGLYADVGFGDDLCYKDGRVIKVYQT